MIRRLTTDCPSLPGRLHAPKLPLSWPSLDGSPGIRTRRTTFRLVPVAGKRTITAFRFASAQLRTHTRTLASSLGKVIVPTAVLRVTELPHLKPAREPPVDSQPIPILRGPPSPSLVRPLFMTRGSPTFSHLTLDPFVRPRTSLQV